MSRCKSGQERDTKMTQHDDRRKNIQAHMPAAEKVQAELGYWLNQSSQIFGGFKRISTVSEQALMGNWLPPQKLEKGVEIAGRMIKRVKEEKMCDGVHIMAIGKEELVPEIMTAAGLI